MMTPQEFESKVEEVMSDPRFFGTRKMAEKVIFDVYRDEIPSGPEWRIPRRCDCGNPLDDDQEESCIDCYVKQLEVEDHIAIAQQSHSREDC